MTVSVDEAIARARGAYDVLMSQSLRDYADLLRRHNYTPAEIMAAVADQREELIAERDARLAQFREELTATLREWTAEPDAHHGSVH